MSFDITFVLGTSRTHPHPMLRLSIPRRSNTDSTSSDSSAGAEEKEENVPEDRSESDSSGAINTSRPPPEMIEMGLQMLTQIMLNPLFPMMEDSMLFGPSMDMMLHQTLNSGPPPPPKASPSAVKSLPKIKVGYGSDGLELVGSLCTVCQGELEKNDVVLMMPCGHSYHSGCLLPWLKTRNSCPDCRYELATENKEYNSALNERQRVRDEQLRLSRKKKLKKEEDVNPLDDDDNDDDDDDDVVVDDGDDHANVDEPNRYGSKSKQEKKARRTRKRNRSSPKAQLPNSRKIRKVSQVRTKTKTKKTTKKILKKTLKKTLKQTSKKTKAETIRSKHKPVVRRSPRNKSNNALTGKRHRENPQYVDEIRENIAEETKAKSPPKRTLRPRKKRRC